MWTSPNATRWSKTALPTPTGEGSAAANAATDWGSREVVVGSAGTGPSMRAAVWVSENPGQPFLPIPDNPVFDAPTSGSDQGGAVMDTVAAGALGLFAGGTVDGRATVWYSTDGEHWQELTGADSVINHDPGAVVNDILSTPNGVFAAGSSINGNRLSAALWYSSDGIHWLTVRSAVSTFFGNGDHVITSLLDIGGTGNSQLGAPGPTGLLAVGGVRLGSSWQPASWISPNGFSWSQTSESFPLDAEPPGSPGAIAYAAAGADGALFAVGGSPGRQRLWQSDDGLAWSEVRLPTAAAADTGWHLGLVAANGHTTVLADNIPGQPYVLVDQDGRWHQPSAQGTFGSPLPDAVPTSLIADNGTLVMSVELSKPGQSLGSGASSVAVLTSDDGSSWRTDNAHAFDGVTVNQLLAVPDGLLAVGSAPLAGAQGGEAVEGTGTPLSPACPATMGPPGPRSDQPGDASPVPWPPLRRGGWATASTSWGRRGPRQSAGTAPTGTPGKPPSRSTPARSSGPNEPLQPASPAAAPWSWALSPRPAEAACLPRGSAPTVRRGPPPPSRLPRRSAHRQRSRGACRPAAGSSLTESRPEPAKPSDRSCGRRATARFGSNNRPRSPGPAGAARAVQNPPPSTASPLGRPLGWA